MNSIDERLDDVCAAVGIRPPRDRREGLWLKTDTLGKNGRGDGRVRIGNGFITAFNWQTGETKTVGLNGRPLTAADRRKVAEQIERDRALQKKKADEAAKVAEAIIAAASPSQHDYLVAKGFRNERALVVPAEAVRRIGGRYLLPEDPSCRQAIVIPARLSGAVRSVQLIWESGQKKFLAKGEIHGASHRIAAGNGGSWLCEGYATGLTLRRALKAFGRSDTVLCCFSAANICAVARRLRGKCYIAADNDKPIEQYGNKGTGEYWALQAERPYVMPPALGTDFNDMEAADGAFAVQRVLSNFLREAGMR
jgi:putative DNA primase/helicase